MTGAEVDIPLCWWCGAIADSREHKFTAYELRLTNGPGPWIGDDAVVHGDFSERTSQVQGPNSTLAKFPPSMCANCNNARSQPFDRACQKMLAYLVDHEEAVGTSRRFRFSDVYGVDWAAERTNLIKYWISMPAAAPWNRESESPTVCEIT